MTEIQLTVVDCRFRVVARDEKPDLCTDLSNIQNPLYGMTSDIGRSTINVYDETPYYEECETVVSSRSEQLSTTTTMATMMVSKVNNDAIQR